MDPNEVVGRPQEREVWLAPDWSVYKPVTAVQPTGYTRVSIRTTTYKDGHVTTQVLDANHQPITTQVIPEEPDPDVKKAWDAAQNTATPNNGSQLQRQPDGTINQWDPNGLGPNRGGYTIPRPDLTPQKATIGRVEGTPIPGQKNPDGSPAYDNNQPIWVERDANNQQVGPAKPLTAEQRKQWDEDRQRSRNPGGVPDAQLPQNAGITYRKNPQTGQLEKVTTTTVNGVTSTKVEPVDPKDRVAIGAKTVVSGNKTTKVTTWRLPDGSTQETVEEDQAAPKPGTIVKGGGPNKEDIQAIEDPDHPGQVKYVPIPGAEVPSDQKPIPTDAPKFTPDYSQDDLGLTAYHQQLLAWVGSDLSRNPAAQKLMETAGGLATQTASHGTTLRSQASTTRAQDITQRGQDITEVDNRRSSADTGFDTSLKEFSSGAPHLGRGNGGLAAEAFRSALNLRQQNGVNAGGYADIAQVPGPVTPALQAARASTQVSVGPDGNVHVSPPGALPPETAAAAVTGDIPGVRTGSAMTGTGVDGLAPVVSSGPAFSPRGPEAGESVVPPVNPFPGEPGNNPNAPVGQVPAYLQAARAPVFDPSGTVDELRAKGFTEAAIADALQQHQAEYGNAA